MKKQGKDDFRGLIKKLSYDLPRFLKFQLLQQEQDAFKDGKLE